MFAKIAKLEDEVIKSFKNKNHLLDCMKAKRKLYFATGRICGKISGFFSRLDLFLFKKMNDSKMSYF